MLSLKLLCLVLFLKHHKKKEKHLMLQYSPLGLDHLSK